MPRPVAEMFATFDANTAHGAVGNVTGDLESLIGRTPMTLTAWLAENVDVLRV